MNRFTRAERAEGDVGEVILDFEIVGEDVVEGKPERSDDLSSE